MISSLQRTFYVAYLLAVLSAVLCLPASAQTDIDQESALRSAPAIPVDIPAQALGEALVLFSTQSNTNIIGLSSTFEGIRSQAVIGSMPPLQALGVLLDGTGLNYKLIGARSISIQWADPIVRNNHLPLVNNEHKVLEEVVVTGIKRQRDLQKTPLAITHIGEQDIDLHHVRDLRDISNLVPGLELVSTGPQESVLVQLRGVGTTNITEIADGPVSVHVDGIYSPRSQGVAALLHDINRIEVLRGPQGTLFGRNSSSGSINVYHNKPSFEADSFDLELGIGSDSQRSVRLVTNWALSETFALRLSGADQQHDAFTKLLDSYVGLGPHYPTHPEQLEAFDQSRPLGQRGLEREDRDSWRLSALWRPLNQLEVGLSFERYQDNGTGNAELDPTLVEQGKRAVVLDTNPFVNLDNEVLRARAEYRFDNGITAVYQAGRAEMHRSQLHDTDHGRTGDFEIERTVSSEFDFYSHELHIKNDNRNRFRWIVGAFTSRESNNIVFAVDQQNVGGLHVPNNTPSWISGLPGAAVSFAIQPDRRSESLGVYSQFGYDLNENSRLTLGARFNRDTKSDRGGRAINCRFPSDSGPYLDANSIGSLAPAVGQVYADPDVQAAIDRGQFFNNGTSLGIGDQPCWVRQVNDNKVSWSNTSGVLRYDIDLGPDTLIYSSISSGFKAGHIQDAGNTADPETVVSYELGLKSQFLNDTLRINTALFQADYQDLQFSDDDRIDSNGDGVPDSGGSTVVRNASDARIKGLELELKWLASERDLVQASVFLMDAKFRKFDIPDSAFGNLFNPFSELDGETAADDVDLSGNSPPRTPDWKLSLSYEHDYPIGNGMLTFGGLATFSDEYFLDIFNRGDLPAGVFPGLPEGGTDLGLQDSYAVFDLNVRYKASRKRWSVEAYVKNIGDEAIKISSGNFITENGFTANYLPPRTYGVLLKVAM